MKRQPEDPMIQNLVQMVRQAQVSRRNLLRGGAVGAAGAGALALSGCSSSGGGDIDRGDGSAGSIVWGNWTYYLDYDEEADTYPTLDAFGAQTNIDVEFREDIDDNNTFYGKIRDQLKLGQHVGYDTITLSDWMNGRLIESGYVQELDLAAMPNTENLIPSLRDSLKSDPGRKFSMPWQAPGTGFVWNTEAVPGGIKSIDDLLQPELKGKVGVLSEMRDTMGMIMLGQGVDVSGDWGDAEFERALEWLQKAIKDGYIANIKGNSYVQDLEKDVTLAGIAWTGDVAILNSEQGNRWTMELPESGGLITADSFTIPNGTDAENKKLVEELINYYYEPEVAATVADYVWYICPVEGAQEAMEKVNPEQVDNPFIFPDEQTSSRMHGFRTLTPQENKKYTQQFSKVLGV